MIPILPDAANYGPAAYKEFAARNHLLVTSMFYTYQGEGPFTGTPSVFLRLSGCNLGKKEWCDFCDADFRFEKGKEINAGDVAAFSEPYKDFLKLFVITGGEPLLQWQALRNVMPTVDAAHVSRHVWQFETNGILLDEEMLAYNEAETFFVISPKIVGKAYQPLPEAIYAYPERVALKYVVSADPNSPYHKAPITQQLTDMFDVYISGMTAYGPNDCIASPGHPVSIFSLSEKARYETGMNYAYAARMALQMGCQVSFQSHLFGAVE